MGKYKYDFTIEDILYEPEVRKMLEVCEDEQEKALIAVCWLTGARTSELTKIKKEDITITENSLGFKIFTEKLRGGKFTPRYRNLIFKRGKFLDQNLWIETVVRYVNTLKPGENLFNRSPRTIQLKLNRIGKEAIGKEVCPGVFRHSILTHLASSGLGIQELASFKGCSSISGIQPYLKARVFEIDLNYVNRTKNITPEQKQQILVEFNNPKNKYSLVDSVEKAAIVESKENNNMQENKQPEQKIEAKPKEEQPKQETIAQESSNQEKTEKKENEKKEDPTAQPTQQQSQSAQSAQS